MNPGSSKSVDKSRLRNDNKMHMTSARLFLHAAMGSLLVLTSKAYAGPQDSFVDQCLYKYANTQGQLCLTRNGRVIGDGRVVGMLNQNYTFYKNGVSMTINGKPYYEPGVLLTSKFQQVNQANTLVEYVCASNANGTCTRQSYKNLYQYVGTN